MNPSKNFVSIKHKFSKYLVFLSIVPMLGVGIISGILSLNALERNSAELVESATDRIASETDTVLSNATKIAEQIANDSSIQQSLSEPLPLSDKDVYALDLMLDSRLGFIQEHNDNIYGIYVIAENGGIYRSTFHTIRNEHMKDSSIYQNVIFSQNPIWFEPHLGSYVGISTEIPLISVGIRIEDKTSSDSLGIVLVEIPLSEIQYIYNQGFLEDGYAFLLNDAGKPIVYPDSMTAYNQLTYEDAISTRSSQYMYIQKPSTTSSFQTVSVVSYGNIYQDAVHILLLVFILTGGLSVVAILLAHRLSTNISNPITQLTAVITSVKTNDLTVQMDSISNDEVGILSTKFNEMMQEINHYTTKEIEDLKKLQKTEFEALQSQINPHFLYNTLDSVIWMARTGNTEEVIKMITALTLFFRISLSKGQNVITIEKEKQHLESYLTIQSMRYSSILSYEIDIPEMFFNHFTLKLLLQPFVENAIYHGIKAVEHPGIIKISAFEDSENIYFCIEDNGLGMEPNTLDNLNAACRTTDKKSIDSYGVINVSRRMQIVFGKDYYPIYTSVWMEGTKVTVPIPKTWKEDPNNENIT